jgi:hypothetical protein
MSKTAQWARILDAAAADLKAWDAAERDIAARFKADTDALRGDFDRAMAALSGAPVQDIRGRDSALMRARGER